MQKYRKKPVVVEAVQWNGDNYDEVSKFTNVVADPKSYLDVGDWIIKEAKNVSIHSVKPDIFEQTYEVVVDHNSPNMRDNGAC